MDINGVVGIITAVWAFIGIILPILIQFLMWRSPHKGIVQVCLILTAACCYLFWLSAYLSQLNPLIGPQLETGLIRMIQFEWDGMHHSE
ncbi:V-type proton ATPase subunit e 2-like [Pomacea canaliculata]|uniref:V-type proton ATPase subunit e 2-like n=1 Tax=Pomacea canaliculata TaxID=400727 RepID=UPI000D73AB17|nr:V-type proton ATPase subunit e 2-like [Pomacea canaliculata]